MFSAWAKIGIAKIALSVFAFFYFATAHDVRKVEASCGDYLKHTAKHGVAKNFPRSHSEPVCKDGSCRAAPMSLPAEPVPTVDSQRQHADYRCSDNCSLKRVILVFESVDDSLPASATLEVLTPPPIAIDK
jgi:hypothetical protein